MLHPRPYFLYFILKSGLTKLRRASLSRERETAREGERERERVRERAEAGREPGSSGLRLPKYRDYKRAPPRPACGDIIYILLISYFISDALNRPGNFVGFFCFLFFGTGV